MSPTPSAPRRPASAALAERWRGAIARTGYVGLSAGEVRRRLLPLTDRLLDALLAEPPDPDAGRQVGAALVRLGYTAPEALGRTQAVLADQLAAGLPPGQAAALSPRLTALLAALAVGFAGAAREVLLAEQETIRDALLSENRRAAAALRRQAALLDLAPVAILVREAAGDAIAFWNRGAEAAYGWTRDEAVGRPLHAVLRTRFPRPREEIEAELRRAGHWEGELVHTRRDGTALTVASRWAAQRDDRGRPVAVLEIHTDVTAGKRLEAALREREASLEAAQRIAHLGSFDWDAATGALTWSDELGRLLGWAPGEVTPSLPALLEAVHPEDRPALRGAVQAAAGAAAPLEFRTAGRDGAGRTLHSQTEVVRDAGGRAVRVIGTALDITARKQAERDRQRFEAELEAARDAAEAASRAKSEFLANMSHEIRTPMNAILGMAEVLAETPLTPEQREYVAIFRQAGDALLTLINDILDLSKVEAGQLELEATEFDPAELAEGALEVLAVRAHTKGLELTCEVDADVPARVRGDPQRLRQVLLNLLGNAVKFTERGEVRLHLSRAPAGAPGAPAAPGAVALRVAVQDTGIGIPPAQLATVFAAFTQADASTTRRYGGSGLGLAIVDRLVALMGGRVAAASVPGEGSTFTVVVPLEVPAAPAPAPPDADRDLTGARVLVADDSPTNRLILRHLLEAHGAAVTEAAGGAAAVAAVRAAGAGGAPYHLLLLDHRMPDLDGFDVLACLAEPAGALPPAVLLLSSDQRAGDAERARALGVPHFLVKPVKRAALLAAAAAALRPAAAAPPPPPVPPPSPRPGDGAPPPPRRLLLVDDSVDNRRLVQLYLKGQPYTLDTAADGREGLGVFRPGRYDLVLMDVNMPVLDGLEATRAIRAWEHQQDRPPTPIVALTASAMPEDVRRALEAGCDAHLAKPVKKQALLEAIARYAVPAGTA